MKAVRPGSLAPGFDLLSDDRDTEEVPMSAVRNTDQAPESTTANMTAPDTLIDNETDAKESVAEFRCMLTRVSRRLFDSESSRRPVKAYLDAVGDIRTLTQEEEVLLANRAKAGDEAARNAMVMSNLRLVAAIAKRYKNRGLPMQDLLQEGNIGLMRAVKKFDPEKGHRFATYAAWWIRESMTRALSNKSRTVRLPVHLTEFMTKLRRIRAELSIELGRKPTSAEIADVLGVTEDKVESVLQSSQPCLSLDKKINTDEGDGCVLADTVPDVQSQLPEDDVDLQFARKHIDSLLSKLSERERRVVSLRFGLGTGRSRKLREVSKIMGLTRDQVGKVSCRAMRKLREYTKDGTLETYLA